MSALAAVACGDTEFRRSVDRICAAGPSQFLSHRWTDCPIGTGLAQRIACQGAGLAREGDLGSVN